MRGNSAPDIVIAPAEGSKHGRMQRQARLSANRLHVKKSHLRESRARKHFQAVSAVTGCLHSAYLCNNSLAGNGAKPLKTLASSARFERATPRLGIWCSILLSYEDPCIH